MSELGSASVSERFGTIGSDGAPVKLGLMGGTFDPIHVGHLVIADELADELGLDAVLFIPTGIPVFKREQNIVAGAKRLEMCRRAVRVNPRFDVCPIEVEREGDTFTVDTLRALRAYYPANVEFFLIVGSDTAATIWKWRESAAVADLAHLAVAARPGTATDASLRESIMQGGPFDVTFVDVPGLEISSRDIRARIKEGRAWRHFVPQPVTDYILDEGLYGVEEFRRAHAGQKALVAEQETLGAELEPSAQEAVDSSDALTDEFFEARKAELATRVNERRFVHIMGVVEACEQLARTYGLDVRKARLAGLLHDWDKNLNDEQARERVLELGMEDEIDPWVIENMPRVLHSYTAARALERDFPQIPADVIQAIYRHTTADEDMSDLDKVLYIADAIEPNRQFGRIDELRALVGTVDLDELYIQTYDYWIFLLFERKKTLHPDTIRIWNANAVRRANTKG